MRKESGVGEKLRCFDFRKVGGVLGKGNTGRVETSWVVQDDVPIQIVFGATRYQFVDNTNPWMAIGLWENRGGVMVPIGIADLELEDLKTAKLSFGNLSLENHVSTEGVLSDDAWCALREQMDPMAGLEILSEYKGNGLGRLLWLVSLKTLGMMGVTDVRVVNDVSGGSEVGRKSIYLADVTDYEVDGNGNYIVKTNGLLY